MPILIIVLIVVFALLIVGPSYWTKKILKQHEQRLERLPGTGGELAKHFIIRFKLPVELEQTEQGDHYDPIHKKVCLREEMISGQSLSAVAVAAHEVGHAMQDHVGWPFFRLRTILVKLLAPCMLLGNVLFLCAPVAAFWSPRLAVTLGLCGLAMMLARVVVHLVTLPVEFDASFGKALPVLAQGGYLEEQDYIVVRKILLACAMTYVSATLMDTLLIFRWMRFLRI